MLEPMLERFRHGDRMALARLLSMLARGEHVAEILAAPGPSHSQSRVVAFTGSGGVGKSTLIGKLIEVLRGRGKRVAVLACDPQSPLTGGALLGDRFRMGAQPDDGIFIRSLATPGGQGGVVGQLDAMVRLLEAFGFDVVLIETVGSGQGDTVVQALADVLVLLLQPETGDDLQWEKAGILEVADVIFIHKADLPGAEHVEAQVRTMLGLSHRPRVAILRGSAKTGAGIAELWEAIEACPLRNHQTASGTRDLLQAAQAVLADRLAKAEAAGDPELTRLVARWQERRVNREETAFALLQFLVGSNELSAR